MQAVSTAFKNAAVATDIVPVREVKITLIDNLSIGASITPAAAESDATNFPKGAVINSKTVQERRWAFADPYAEGAGGRCLADGSWYPYSLGYEGGWWGNTLADDSGNIGGGGEVFTLTYATAITLQQVAFWANVDQGLPVDFVVAYDPTGSAGFTTLTTVTGNTQTAWNYTVSPSVACKILKITITKVNHGKIYTKLVEFQGGLVVDVTLRANRIEILQERYPDNATLEIGDASAGELMFEQDNTDGAWSPHNASSPYQTYLKSNRKIAVKVGFQYTDGTTELVPLGTFYTMAWSATGANPIALVKAQDRMKRLRERKYRNCPLQINKTVDQAIRQALIDAGLSAGDYSLTASSTTIGYAWASPDQSFFDYVSKLAAADGGVVYFDENDVFRFQDANYLHNNSTTSLMTFTDSNAIIAGMDEWNEGEVKNRVVVNINALKLAASAQLWALQESLSVPAGGSVTITAALSSAATAIATPSFTQSSTHITLSWAAYAQTVALTFSNSGGAAESVLTCTISGQSIQADGTNIATAEDTSLVNQDGARELAISNPFIQTRAVATALASTLLAIYKNPPAKLKVESVGLPHLELGDRVTVNSSKMGINSDFWVIRHNFADSAGFRSALDLIAVV